MKLILFFILTGLYCTVQAQTTLTTSSHVPRSYPTITELKAATTIINGTVAFTSGYYAKGDGGGAKYYYDSLATDTQDSGSVFTLNSGQGRWKAMFDDMNVSVLQFGVKADGTTDNSWRLQVCMDYCDDYNHLVNFGTTRGQHVMYIPATASTITFKHLNLKNASIKGAGQGTQVGSRLQVLSGTDTAAFTLASAPLQQVSYEDFSVLGNSANTGQHCFNFKAVAQTFPSFTGGIWYCHFKNMVVKDFAGASFYFYAIDGAGDMASQLNTFTNVYVLPLKTTAASRAIYMYGQVGQFLFNNCMFEGATNTVAGARLIDIISEPLSSNDQAGNIEFNTCTFEGTETAFFLYNVGDITAEGCWFEDLKKAIIATGHSRISVDHGHLANAANGGGTGYFADNQTSYVSLTSNSWTGTTDACFKSSNGTVDGWYFKDNNSPNAGWTFPVSGTFLQTSISGGGAISTAFNTNILVNTSATQLKTITSSLEMGSDLYLQAWSGTVTVATGGNINIIGGVSKTYSSGAPIHLHRVEAGGTWLLIDPSIGITDKKPYFYDNIAAAQADYANIPNGALVITSGYYAGGDGGGMKYVYNSSSSATADGGSVITMTTGRLLAEIESNGVDVTTFGAKGDAVNNDSAFFVKALAYLATKGGGTLLLNANKIYFAGTIKITTPNIKIRGGGSLLNTTLLVQGSFAGEHLKFDFSGFNIRWSSFTAGNFLTGRNGIELKNVSEGKINHIRFTNCNTALYVYGLDVFQHVNRIDFVDNRVDTTNYGIFVAPGADTVTTYEVGDMLITNNYFYGTTNYSHILMRGVDGAIIQGNHFFFDHTSATKKNNIDIYYGNYLQLLDNQYFEAGEEAIKIGRFENLTIHGGDITWTGQNVVGAGIRLYGGNKAGTLGANNLANIGNLTMEKPTGSGIRLEGMGGVTISNVMLSDIGDATNYSGNPTDVSGASHYSVYADANCKGIIYNGTMTRSAAGTTYSMLGVNCVAKELTLQSSNTVGSYNESYGSMMHRTDDPFRYNYQPSFLYNLVANSNTFTSWSTSNSSVAVDGTVTAADGSSTVYKMSDGTNNTQHVIFSSAVSKITGAADYTFTAYVKMGSGIPRVDVLLTNSAFSHNGSASFDISSGQVNMKLGNVGSAVLKDAQIYSEKDGFYRISLTVNFPSAASDVQVFIYASNDLTSTFVGSAYTGANNYLYIYNGQLTQSSNAIPYIATQSAVQLLRWDNLTKAKQDAIALVTKTQRDAIVSPAVGTQVFNTDDGWLDYYTGSLWGWMPVSESVEWKRKYGWSYFRDFFNNAPDGYLNQVVTNSGAIASSQAPASSTSEATGTLALSLATSATATAGLISNTGTVVFGSGVTVYEARVYIPALSNSTDRYQFIVGFYDNNGGINQTDGVYFLYDEGGISTGSSASANWQLVTSSNTTRTFTGSGTAAAISTWYVLRIEMNAAGTSATFYINGTSVGTVATNIPTGLTRAFGFGAFAAKSVGTTTRNLLLNYIMVKQKYTNSR